MKKSLSILLSPFILALVVSAIIIVAANMEIHKYRIILDDYDIVEKPGGFISCVDFDGDSTSEFMEVFSNVNGNLAFKVFRNDWGPIDQWNFSGKRSGRGKSLFPVYLDEDSIMELAGFYYRDDSVFLSVIQPWPYNKIILHEKFITTIWPRNDTIDYNVGRALTADMTGDGIKEIVFSIVAGFSRQPRRIYYYDFVSDSITSSVMTGIAFNDLVLYDLDGDGKSEAICSSTARGNIHDSLGIPYHDYHSYIAVFDDNLEFLFDPLVLAEYPSATRFWLNAQDHGEPEIITLFQPRANGDNCLVLSTLNGRGEIRSSDTVHSGMHDKRCIVHRLNHEGKSYIVIAEEEGSVSILDHQFRIVDSEIKFADNRASWRILDVDQDGNEEHVLIWGPKKNRLSITDLWIEETAEYQLDAEDIYPEPISLSVKLNGAEQNQILLQRGNFWYLFRYVENPGYYLLYFIYLGIYVGILLFIFGIHRIQKYQLEKKFMTERKIAELKLLTIKGQIDPHFTFNAMNSIGAVIFKEDRKTAYTYFTKFSKLIRLALESSDKLSRTLDEELEFVRLYLELEKFRFKDKIEYHMEVNEEVNLGMHVPRMIIQTFVENAIKHGLLHRQDQGRLWIKVDQKDKLLISVIDNGVGLDGSININDKATGKGFKIISQMLDLYEEIHKKRILFFIKNRGNKSENTTGTEVLITIPLD